MKTLLWCLATLVLGALMGSAWDRGNPAPLGEATGEGAHPLAGVDLRESLVYVPFWNQSNTSEEARHAGRLLLEYLDTGRQEALEEAIAIYDAIIPVENFGGEYPPLRWFATWALASEDARQRMAQDPDAARFLRHFSRDRFRPLRQYLAGKYRLGPRSDADTLWWLDEIVRFVGPGRAEWEGTASILGVTALGEGDVVADIGAGPGFYTFRFSEAVGPSGKVYAIETNQRHLDFIEGVVRAEGQANIHPLVTSGTDLPVPDASVDVGFLCATYQTIYHATRTPDRDRFLANLRRILKPGGRLVVVDNNPVVSEGIPFGGIAIAPELVIGQLEAYGWRLEARHQVVPQRYVLVFRPPVT